MTDHDLRTGLRDVISDEPALGISLDAVVAAGRRRRRHQRATYAASALGVTTLAAVGVGLLVTSPHHSAPSGVQHIALTPLAATHHSGAPVRQNEDTLTAEQQRIERAIVDASPDGWTFEMGPSRWQDARDLEANADDGTGPGRLMIGVSAPVGSQQVHPCSDSEFAAGVSCTERTLPDGAVLSERALIDTQGVRSIEVVLTHPDGTGVGAESGNFTLTWPLPTYVAPDEKRNLWHDIVHVSRTDPTYTVDQLGDVVVAVDRALGGDETR